MWLVFCWPGAEDQAEKQSKKNLDVELVNTLNNIGVENAIITQHTLYPYHFGADAGELNELGQRDLMVLARHFKEHPGILNIRRGETAAQLYDARVAHVLSRLKDAGVETSRMSVVRRDARRVRHAFGASRDDPPGPGSTRSSPGAWASSGSGSNGMITR